MQIFARKSKGSGLFFGPGIGADSQIIAIELLIKPTASFKSACKPEGKRPDPFNFFYLLSSNRFTVTVGSFVPFVTVTVKPEVVNE